MKPPNDEYEWLALLEPFGVAIVHRFSRIYDCKSFMRSVKAKMGLKNVPISLRYVIRYRALAEITSCFVSTKMYKNGWISNGLSHQ